ncbi:hypothetical protein Tco_1080345 [Tanacetum coccineum]|uniref:Reverse transcriptase Ty1/copia-type domain-containing protein n=1 Tax=Tanacetum coccineum TaxID=301880 RepID=A0ABQ5HW08_9ASTR
MSMMGELKFFLGLQVHQSPRGIFISQLQYAIELLKKHGLDECVSMSTPMATERLHADLQGTTTNQMTYRRMIGGLMYLTASRPDIAFATFVCARYQACPTVKHLKEVKQIFQYLRQSYNLGLCWSSKKQDCTAMSTAEAKYVSLSACCAQVIWMRTQLLDYGYKYNRIPMYCDSKSTIAISCNPIQHSKTKHIDIRYHFIKEHVEKGTVEIYFVGTEYQLADLFTKALPKERFEYLVHRIVIIMAQQQHAADDHPDELCPPKKRYDLMYANKKVDLELKFMLDKKEPTLTLDDFRTIFHLPQATDNNYNSFVPPPSFSDMVPFYKQVLGFTMELKISLCFKTTGLQQPRQTLCKIFSKCLTTRVTGWDQPPLQIMQMMYCFVNNIHVDYAELLWEGLYYSLHHPTSLIPYPRFTKIIVSHYMTIFPDISRRAREKRSTRLTPPTPVPNVDKAFEMILQDTLQVTLAEHKIREEQEARENVALVDEHLASEEIEKMVDGQENVVDDSSIPRNDESSIPGTRIEPRSNKENPEVEITKDKEVEITKETLVVDITNVVILVNVNDEDEEITDEVYELKRREKGKIVEEIRNSPIPTPIRSPKIHTNLNQVPVYVAEGLIMERQKAKEETERLIAKAILQERRNIQAQISSQIENAIANVIPSQFEAQISSVDPQLQQQDIAIWLALQMKFERNTVPQAACRTPVVRLRDQDNPHDDAHPKGESSAKRQKTSEYEAYVSGESLFGQVFQEEQAPSTSCNQEQDDDFDFWTDSYALDDDEIPTKQVLQDIMEEVSLTIDEAKMRKMADEMLRQRCTLGDEHQYHIDQMKNFLKSDIVWESRKEIIISPHPRKTTPLVHNCQQDPEAPALSLINQDLLYLKKGNSGPEKIVLSLHKFLVVIFNDDELPDGKQKEPGKPNEEVYSNSKIIQVVKTYWELGHEHQFITKIVARRANKYLVSITEPDYKNLNKNDIKDIYLLIMNGNVSDYVDRGLLCYQQKVNLTAPTMTFPGIEDHEMFSIIYELVHGIIYKNSKKEKRVIRHSEIFKFCDATLNRVLEGLKSYNNDIKYGYVQKDLTKDEAEYLKLFEEEIEERLKLRRQMRRWEMFGNGRPLGPRRECPE